MLKVWVLRMEVIDELHAESLFMGFWDPHYTGGDIPAWGSRPYEWVLSASSQTAIQDAHKVSCKHLDTAV